MSRIAEKARYAVGRVHDAGDRIWGKVGYGKIGWLLFTPYKTARYVSDKLEGKLGRGYVDYFTRSTGSLAAGLAVSAGRGTLYIAALAAADVLSGRTLFSGAPQSVLIAAILPLYEEVLQPIPVITKVHWGTSEDLDREILMLRDGLSKIGSKLGNKLHIGSSKTSANVNAIE